MALDALLPVASLTLDQALIIALYGAGAIFTFAFLLRVGRAGAVKRLRQFGVSMLWPLYWPVIQGPRTTIRIWTKLLTLIAFILLSPIMIAGAAVALLFMVLSRKGIAPRFLFDA